MEKSFEAVSATFDTEIAAILKGECVSKKPSTIIKIDENGIELISEGALPFDEIKDFYEHIVVPTISLGADHGGFEAKEVVKAHLLEMGFEVLDSSTNFLFVKHQSISGIKIYEGLKKFRIIIRHFSSPSLLEDWNRITIGTAEHMQVLLEILQGVITREM